MMPRTHYPPSFTPGQTIRRRPLFHGHPLREVQILAVRRRPTDPRGDTLIVQGDFDLRPWTTASAGWELSHD